MSDAHKAVARRLFEEAVNTGNLTLADEFISAEVVEHEARLARKTSQASKYSKGSFA